MKAISQSQINLYRNCPHAYELHYRCGYEAMMYDPAILYVGRSVHEAIDNYYKHCYTKTNDKSHILALTYRQLRDNWDTTMPVEFLKKAYTCLQNFAEFEAQNNHDLTTKPLTEVKLYADNFMGIIDVVDLVHQRCIDWKTNARASLGYNYKLQAMLYKYLIKHQFDIDLKQFDFVFLAPNEIRTVRFNNPKLKDIAQDIYAYKEAILKSWQTGEFPKQPKTANTCKYCAYRYYCEGCDE